MPQTAHIVTRISVTSVTVQYLLYVQTAVRFPDKVRKRHAFNP